MATERRYVFPEQVRFLSTQSSPSEISLVPYAKVDGHWTLNDEALLSIGRASQSEGTFRTVFCEGNVRTPEDFAAIMKLPSNVPVVAFKGLQPIGIAWLNGQSGNRAFAHFCMLRVAHGRAALKACRMILDYWLSWMDAGEPILDIIIGVIPATNERAIRFVEGIGFVRLGAIPGMMRDVYAGDRAAAVVLYYSRFDHGRR